MEFFVPVLELVNTAVEEVATEFECWLSSSLALDSLPECGSLLSSRIPKTKIIFQKNFFVSGLKNIFT